MKDLCMRFCRQELLAVIKSGESIKSIQDHDGTEEKDYYEQEEMEEEE